MTKRVANLIKKPQIIVVLIVVVIFSGYAYSNSNHYYLNFYQSNDRIAAIAESATFTGKGLATFYRSNPVVLEKDQLDQICRGHEEMITYGCFHPHTEQIFLLRLASEETASLVSVIAAHEMLHKVYGNMHNREKSEINRLIELQVQLLRDDDRYNHVLAPYEDISGDSRQVELVGLSNTE